MQGGQNLPPHVYHNLEVRYTTQLRSAPSFSQTTACQNENFYYINFLITKVIFNAKINIIENDFL